MIPVHERLLKRLWELAQVSPEETRGSMTTQLRALKLIRDIEQTLAERAQEAAPAQAEHAVYPSWLDLPVPDRKM